MYLNSKVCIKIKQARADKSAVNRHQPMSPGFPCHLERNEGSRAHRPWSSCLPCFTRRSPCLSEAKGWLLPSVTLSPFAALRVHQGVCKVRKDGLPDHPDESSLIFLIACGTSSHRRHSMRLTPHAYPVHRFRCQITPLFFGHCGWLTNDGR